MNATTQKEFSLTINGHTYQVKIEELAGGDLAVELDGKIHRISLADIPRSPGEIPIPPKEATRITPPPPETRPAGGPPPKRTSNDMVAPMPGDIVQISVAVGDSVSIGQEVCVLEAMKMKNILRSSSAGVVKSIEVVTGQSVNYGDVLVRFHS